MEASTHTRSNLLHRGALAGAQRPPWTDETRLRAHCTSCSACITACPEAILIGGPAGTPVVDFARGACSFCGACADACDEAVFRATDTAPWALVATIGPDCLLAAGISCQSCTDACDEGALRFNFRGGPGPVGAIYIDHADCTGCGGCLSVCPANAVHLSDSTEVAA